jgi:hypothetical protein
MQSEQTKRSGVTYDSSDKENSNYRNHNNAFLADSKDLSALLSSEPGRNSKAGILTEKIKAGTFTRMRLRNRAGMKKAESKSASQEDVDKSESNKVISQLKAYYLRSQTSQTEMPLAFDSDVALIDMNDVPVPLEKEKVYLDGIGSQRRNVPYMHEIMEARMELKELEGKLNFNIKMRKLRRRLANMRPLS